MKVLNSVKAKMEERRVAKAVKAKEKKEKADISARKAAQKHLEKRRKAAQKHLEKRRKVIMKRDHKLAIEEDKEWTVNKENFDHFNLVEGILERAREQVKEIELRDRVELHQVESQTGVLNAESDLLEKRASVIRADTQTIMNKALARARI